MAVLDVLILPDPPRSVNLGVVKVEGRVTWGSKDISAWVTTNGEVSSSMDTEFSRCEVALHDGLEPVDIGIVTDERGGIGVTGEPRRDPLGDIPLEAARIVDGAVVGDNFGLGESWRNGSKVDSHVLEWSRVNAPTTVSGGNTVEASWQSIGAVMGFVGTVSAHAVVTPVEDGRVEWVVGPFAPVPIGLVSFVATLVSQGLLIGPGEISVP